VGARFRLRDGREFPALSAMDLSLGEVIDLEKVLGVGMDGWSSAMEMAVMLLVSAQRAEFPLTWEQIQRFRPDDVIRVPGEDEDPDGPPVAAGGEPVTPTTTPTSSST
jgi:hypothetical protein